MILTAGVLLCGILTGIAMTFSSPVETVRLNEICGHNKTVIYDTVGIYHDYVELYNPTQAKIDLEGYSLSDDKKELNKYIFGEISIEPGEYMFLWASSPNEEMFIENTAIYLGFSLRDGETVYLSDPAGKVIDKVKIPKTEQDTSYARNSVGEGWSVQHPTPGRENNKVLEERTEAGYVAPPVFSHSSGFYKDDFLLEITCEEGDDIYYTLDGTIPSLLSSKYEEPVCIKDASKRDNVYAGISEVSLVSDYIPEYKIDKANVIRAVAIDEDGNKSDEVIATYFIDFDKKKGYDNLIVLSIVTDPGNLFDYERGIYVTGKVYDSALKINPNVFVQPANYNREGKGWEREAHVEMFDKTGNMQCSQAVGMRIHGGYSTAYNQKSFNLYAKPEIDGKSTIFDGLFHQHESTMMLRNGGFYDWNLTKFADVLNQSLVEDRDVLIQSGAPCQLFLDGEYWGLYNIQEKVDGSFVSSHYGIDEENVVVLKNERVVSGEDEDYRLWQSLVDFAESNDLSREDGYAEISEMMDIQSFIDYYCFQIYVANCDSVANNLARWRTRDKSDQKYCDGRWRWILYDTDDSVGMPVNDRDYAQYYADTFTGGVWIQAPLEETILSSLMKNEEFRERFVVSFMDMANYNFDYQKNVKDMIEDFYQNYVAGAVASHQRFQNENYSEADYRRDVALVDEFYKNRYQYITAYLKKDLGLKGKLNHILLKQNESKGRVYLNTIELKEGEEFEGYYYSDYPVRLRAIPIRGYELEGWNVDGTVISDCEEMILDMENAHVVYPIWRATIK